MSARNFRVRYWLQSMETRSSPLFSTVRAFLLADSHKRLIGESRPIKDGRLLFQAQLEEEGRSIGIDGRGYTQARTTILLQFGAEGKFIKMGEAVVNLGDILNEGRSGEMLSYRVEKCYDRNARITLAITLWEVGVGLQHSQVGELHSRSHCQLPPPRVKMRTAANRNKITTTEYEQLTDLDDKDEDISMISDRHNSIGRTLNRTELFHRKTPQINQEMIDLKTENRIYQHQLAQLEQRFRQTQQEAQILREEAAACRSEVDRLATECETLKTDLRERELHKESQREQLTAEVARMLKLYQESQQERNKLLIQREEETSKEKERAKDGEKRLADERNRVKQLERSEQSFKKKIEEYMSQIAIYEKAIKTEKRTKDKLAQAIDQQRKVAASLASELQSAKQSCVKLSDSNAELQSELQISKFSLGQLEKEVAMLRRSNREQQSQLANFEAEIRLSGEAMRTERSNFVKRIQEIEYDAECEQRNMEAYLEELEIKTSNEQSKNGIINSLRKEVTRLKQDIAAEREHTEELEAQLTAAGNNSKQLEAKLEEYQGKILQLSRETALLESEIKSRRQVEQVQPQQDQPCFTEQQREELIALCYQQRDEVWKKEIQSIESDTRILMEKTKREKEQYSKSLKKLTEELSASQQYLKKYKIKLKQAAEQEQRLKKVIKDHQSKCLQSEKSKNEQQAENNRLEHQIAELLRKLQPMQELEQALKEAEKKASTLKHDCQSIKAELEKEKQTRMKMRADVKELINTTATYLGKSQKHRMFYDQLRCQYIDAELLLVFNSSSKLYCERHNRLRGKLEQLQELRGQLQNKEKECEKINKSLRQERRSQGGSCDSNTSFNRSESQSTTRILQVTPTVTPIKTTQKEELEMRTLKKEVDELRNKLRKESNRYNQLEREAERLRQNLQESAQDLRRVKEDSQIKGEQLNQATERLRVKQKQLETAKEELKEMNHEITSLKNDLEQVSRAFKQEKSQMLKRSTVNRSFTGGRFERIEESSVKTLQLERRLRQTQEQLDKLKREKEDRRTDSTQNRQAKSFEARIKEKDQAIEALRQNLEEQREKAEQSKELHNLKLRKLKEEYEEELQARTKTEKELSQSLADSEERLRQLQKKLKLTEEALKNANAQLVTAVEREEKAKRMTAAEWQLKMKTSQGDLEAQIGILTKRVDELRLSERAAKQGERRKEKEAAQARMEVERSERAVAELTERLELCGVRLKNMEEEECNYKQVIGALQNKIKVESSEERRGQRDAQHQSFDNHSNFSLKTFTFR